MHGETAGHRWLLKTFQQCGVDFHCFHNLPNLMRIFKMNPRPFVLKSAGHPLEFYADVFSQNISPRLRKSSQCIFTEQCSDDHKKYNPQSLLLKETLYMLQCMEVLRFHASVKHPFCHELNQAFYHTLNPLFSRNGLSLSN